MLDTSHSPISPRGPLEQSPSGDNLRQASTALLSLGLDFGENAEVGWGAVGPRRNVEIKYVRFVILGVYICALTTTARIRRHADKDHKKQAPKSRRQTNLCMLVHCFFSRLLPVSICVSLCARVSVHRLPTRVRSHLTVIPYSPETSESRSCDGGRNGLS